MEAEDGPRADGGRIASSDEHEDEQRREEDRVARLAPHVDRAQGVQDEPGGERDVKPRHHQQMVEASPPVPGHHPAIELRSAAEQERRERTPDVPIERGIE